MSDYAEPMELDDIQLELLQAIEDRVDACLAACTLFADGDAEESEDDVYVKAWADRRPA